MNIQQINNYLPIFDFLERSGINPSYQEGECYWYTWPIREAESTHSFTVDTRHNRWYDFGTGKGSKLFDLARKIYESRDVTSVIEKVTSLFLHSTAYSGDIKSPAIKQQQALPAMQHSQINHYSDHNLDQLIHRISPQSTNSKLEKYGPRKKNSQITIKSVESLGKSNLLIRYLNQRGISKQTAKHYCKEVCFSINEMTHLAVGFENRSGGYELRSDRFEGSSFPEDISFIANGSNAIFVVQEFIDFLSLVELRCQLPLNANFLVLNSSALLPKSLSILLAHRDVFLFLYRSEVGRETAKKFLQAGVSGIDCSGFYRGFENLNQYLVSLQTQRKTSK